MRAKSWFSTFVKPVMVMGVVVLTGAAAFADDAAKPLAGPATTQPTTQPDGRRGGFGGQRGGGDFIKNMIAKAMENVNPTDDQKAKIKTILEDGKAKMDAWREKNKATLEPLQAQMKTARENKDRDKMQELRKQMQPLMETAPKPKEITDQIRAVLTDDQKKVFDHNVEEMRANAGRNGGGGGMGGGRRGGPDGAKPAGDKNKLDI